MEIMEVMEVMESWLLGRMLAGEKNSMHLEYKKGHPVSVLPVSNDELHLLYLSCVLKKSFGYPLPVGDSTDLITNSTLYGT